MKYRNMIVSVIIIFVMIIQLCSCEPYGYTGDDCPVSTLVQYDCPITNTYWGYSERVEVDEYGRVLFKYWGGNDMFREGDMCIYGIIQKYNEEYVWYYESDSYILGYSWESFTDKKLNDFKVKNDWGKELNLDKTVQVQSVVENKRVVEFGSTPWLKDLYESMTKDGEKYVYLPISSDENGQWLFLFRIFTQEYESGSYKLIDITSYAIIVQPDGTYSENSIVKLDDFYNPQDQIKALKAAHNWKVKSVWR